MFVNLESFDYEIVPQEEEEVVSIVDNIHTYSTSISRKRKAQKTVPSDELPEETAKKIRELEQSKLTSDFVQAASAGSFEQMKKLVESGARLNDKVCGFTALMYAAFYGRYEMTEYLLRLSVSVNEKNLCGQTALMNAVERSHRSVVEILVKANADVNITDQKGLSALHKAVRGSSFEIIKLLVEIGRANVNLVASKEAECCTPLHEASFYGQKEVVEYLLEHDAIVDQQNSQGKTALHRAVYKNYTDIVRLLLDCGAFVDAKDNHSRTSLHWAAFSGHLNALQILLEYGADTTVQDNGGLTAEDIAKNKKHWAVYYHLRDWNVQQKQR